MDKIGSSLLTSQSQALTSTQLKLVFNHTQDLIEGLDEVAINELFSGTEKDVDKMIGLISQEVTSALFTNQGTVKAPTFDYLEKLTSQFDYQLKKQSFNYFVITTLPEFDLGLHHIEWGNMVQLYKWLCILAARDHSKSYTFSYAFPLWKMFCYEKEGYGFASKKNSLNKKGMIITDEGTLASKFLTEIAETIENNPILREKLLPKVKDNWGKTEITCSNGAELSVKGSNSALRGRHPGWIVVDDFLNESHLYSQTIREGTIDLFHSSIMNLLVPNGQIVVIGTPFAEGDLYGNLKKSPGWRVFEYPGILPDGRLLFPERHTLKSLLAKKASQGTVAFSREILVKPISSDSTIFPYSLLENAFIGMGAFTIVDNINNFKRKFKRVVVGCDFAISANISADYVVFTVVGVDELDNYWLLHQYRDKGISHNQQIAKLQQIKANFSPDVIMMEDNAFQKVMLDLAREAGMKVVSHTTTTNKYDLKSGLPGLAVLFEQNKVKFPRGDEKSKQVTDIICMEASSITWAESGKFQTTGEHDDSLYSLWIAIKAAHYVNETFSFEFV